MNNILEQLNTGLLSYSRTKNLLGPGLEFRETEVIKLSCFILDYNYISPTLLTNEITSLFNNIYSGNIYVNVFNIVPEINSVTSDFTRGIKFNVEVENRLPVSDNFISQPELTGNNLYTGINGPFWTQYGTMINSFSENFNYDKRNDGSIESNHNISFNLLTGGYNIASGIANYVYNGDIGSEGFYTSLTTNLIFTTGISGLIDPTLVRQYYTENYDTLRNNYSFNKRTEYPSLLSENNNQITKEIKNTMVLDDNGIITITENGKIKAFLNFTQAINEFNSTVLNNNIYNRCVNMYNSLTGFGNITGNSQLNNYPIKNDIIYNKPGLILDYSISFNDDPNFYFIYDTVTEKVIEVELIEEKYINITHSYDFTRLAHITSGQTGIMMNAITGADIESNNIIPIYYSGSQLYNSFLPNIPRIRESFSLPVRHRNFNAKFIYSNEPIYFLNINNNTYPKLQWKINNEIPSDMVNEYKIVNRPQQTTVLSYSYQTSPGMKTISINGYLTRNYGNTFTSPQNINSQFYPLFLWGINMIMSTFSNQQVLAFSYYLDACSIKFDSENNFEMSISVKYVIKRYEA